MTKSELIKDKDLVIVQKGNYLKACRVVTKRPQKFGKFGEGQIIINLDNGIGHPFGTIFKLVRGSKRTYDLELHDDCCEGLDLDVESGIDNRNILDDGQSQSLSKSDIKQLVESGISGDEVIQTIAQNNKTFTSKTKYSQEKYVSKKLRKYDELVTLHKPSVRLLSHMYYCQDPLRISNLRIDSLSQILAYVNVQPGGSYVVYEAGMQGLVTAAMLSHMGISGSLVHVYSGAYPHKEAIELMGFTNEELTTLSFIGAENLPVASPDDVRPDHENGFSEVIQEVAEIDDCEEKTSRMEQPSEGGKARKFVRCRSDDIRISTKVLSGGVSGMVVACRQHPLSITTALLSYLNPGHSFAVYSPYKETLIDIFMELKTGNCVNIRLVENWLRNYQVLPQRTHPEVNMSGGGGYVLTGWKVEK